LWRTDHANAIYCLLTPDGFSALHRLREDEAWVHVAGSAVEQVVLFPDGTSEVITLGKSLQQVPHSRVPAGSWQAASTKGEWSLVVCMLAPASSGFEPADAATDLTPWPTEHVRAREFIRG